MLVHLFVNPHADGSDSTKTQPSNWNAEHAFSGSLTGSLIYRDTGAPNGANWLPTPAGVGLVLMSNGLGAAPSYQAVALATSSVTRLFLGDGTAAAPALAFTSEVGSGLYRPGNGNIALQVLGTTRINLSTVSTDINATDGGAYLRVSVGAVFVNSAQLQLGAGGAPDVVLQRDAANVLALKNGTTAQSFVVYAPGLVTTDTDGLVLQNTTLATAGVPVQISPRLRFRSHVWNTTAVAADNTSDVWLEGFPQSSTTPNSLLRIGISDNGGGTIYPLSVGGYPSTNTFSAMWIGVTPTVSNYAFLAPNNGTQTMLNSGSGQVELRIANVTHFAVGSAGIFVNGPSNAAPTIPLTINNAANTQSLFTVSDAGLFGLGPTTTTGVGFDLTTDSQLWVKNRAQSADGNLKIGAITASGILSSTSAGIFTGVTGGSGVGRSDAQLELRNAAAGHALLSIFQNLNPGTTVEEASINLGQRDSAGVVQQMVGIAGKWAVATAGAVVGLLNLHCTFGTSSTDNAFRIFANSGIVLYGPDDVTFPGKKLLKIYRQAGTSSIVGDSGANPGLVLDGSDGGSASVFLNSISAGDVVLAIGGGDVQLGKALVALGGGAAPTFGTIGATGPATAAQNSWARLKDSTGAIFWVPAWK